jgi:hypothetical protein
MMDIVRNKIEDKRKNEISITNNIKIRNSIY